jgi:rhamnosyltransferase
MKQESDIKYTVGIVIVTFNAANHLHRCVTPILESELAPKVLIIDSSSDDETSAIAKKMNLTVHTIERDEFNHGATREIGRKLLATDIVIMMTQDAYPTDKYVIQKLIEPITSGKATIAYARQIPRPGATFFESFPRQFNYPADSHIRSIQDIDHYGVYTFFCSNSCAAYLNSALDEIGGFKSVLISEDYLAIIELLQKGHRIAYVAEAMVEHSHRYSAWQEFTRYFDTGYARMQYKGMHPVIDQPEDRGMDYLQQMIKQLQQNNIFLIPYALYLTFLKWAGYKCGRAFYHLPYWINMHLSSQKQYWQSAYYHQALTCKVNTDEK